MKAVAGKLGVGGPRRRAQWVRFVMFIDEHRDRFGGVEPISAVLTGHGVSIAASTYYAAKSRRPWPVAGWDLHVRLWSQMIAPRRWSPAR